MYGSNPCGAGLGAHSFGEPTLNGGNGPNGYGNGNGGGSSWWEQPAAQIGGAIAQRIGGSTSPYSPGTYRYGDPGYNVPVTYPTQMVTRAPAMTMATGGGMVVIGLVALGAAKFFGLF